MRILAFLEKGYRHVQSMVDGHPYKVKVVGSSPTVPIHLGT